MADISKKNEIIKLRKKGLTVKRIAKLVGCAISTVSYHINKEGLGCPNHKDVTDEEILNYYLEVASLRLTAKHFNISREYVRSRVPDDKLIGKVKKITNSDSVIEWRKRKKIELVLYKGGGCVCCGYNKNYSVLQFHHIDPSEKDFAIGGKSISFEKLKKEADKCILVCANCHIEIHDEINKLGSKQNGECN